MTTATPYALDALIPHAPPMVLLDSLESVDTDRAVCLLHVRRDFPFVVGAEMPAMVAIELIAQAAAAQAGYVSLADGKAVKIGYLVSVRESTLLVPTFQVGDDLRVEVTVVFGGTSSASYNGVVTRAGDTVATASLSVLREERS
jgi:predicted hotdog family 3-hydroxylacyl-ACP dehydratase